MSASDKEKKSKIIDQFKRAEKDTGSPEVQIALLTDRIQSLTKHFEKHIKDNHSRRGMMKLIAHRKNLLRFLREENIERYRTTLNALGLRK